MANLASNPWSILPSDVTTGSITAATGLTLNADGTVTITTTAGYNFNTSGVEPALGFTVIGAANALYNGFYALISGASGATSFVMKPQFSIPAGTAQSGSGTIGQCLYRSQVRIEDMSWQGLTGAAAGSLDLRDRAGNIVWQAALTGVAGGTVGYQNRGKLFWVNGLTPITMQANTILLITVD